MSIPTRTINALLFSIILAGCSFIQEFSQQYPSPEYAEFLHLERIDPVPEVNTLLGQGKYAEAESFLSYFMDFSYVNEDPRAIDLYQRIKDTRSEWLYKLKKANEGFIFGNSDEIEGEVAAVVSDFLGIGDLRDLGLEGKKFLQGQDVDRVNVALASFGAGALAASVVTAGASNSTKPALSFLKLTNKAKKMPDWLALLILNTSKDPNKQNINQLAGLFNELHGLYKNAGAKSSLDLLSKSKSYDDFKILASFGSEFGSRSSTLLKLAGDDVVNFHRRSNTYPKRTFLESSTFGSEGLIALEKNGTKKFQDYLAASNIARRRMTNYEMALIATGNKVKVLGNDFVKRDQLFIPKYADGLGRSNVERMKLGFAPIGLDGNPINIHHMKQQRNGTLVEMSQSEHQHPDISNKLHRYARISEIDRDEFNLLRTAYWRMRAKDFE